jgi:RNA polymerase sigma factor (sigma-70 family)
MEALSPASSDDLGLLRADHDPDAFARFYDRHAAQILRYFARRTTSVDWAADLTAETFAEAFLSASSYRAELGPAQAWLFGIARHVLSRSLRRHRVEARARHRLGMEPIAVSDEALERVERLVDVAAIRATLDAALEGLSPRLRDAVRLRVGEALPFDVVAQRLGCSVNAARVRVTRGMQQLIATMEQP